MAEWKKILLAGDAAVLSDTAPVNVLKQTAAAGVATEASRQDHAHDVTVAAPGGDITENATAAEGTATGLVRSDHVHASPATWTPAAHLLGSHTEDTLANLNAIVSDATLDDSTATRTPSDDSVGAAQIDETAEDIAFSQVILTPKTAGAGTTEGSLFYDSDDDHLYVYVV